MKRLKFNILLLEKLNFVLLDFVQHLFVVLQHSFLHWIFLYELKHYKSHDENGVLNDHQEDFDRDMLRRESNLHQFVPRN